MKRLKSLSLALLELGLKKEASAILKLSGDSDVYYAAVINRILDSLQSGDYTQVSNGPGIFLTYYLRIKVPELSKISDYDLDEISIFILIKDPKLSAGLSEKEVTKREKMTEEFMINSSDIPYASQFSFRMDDKKFVSSVDIIPNYELFQKISGMNPQDVISELLNSNPWDREYSLMTAIAHEVTHAIDDIRSGGKSFKQGYLESLSLNEGVKLLEGGELSEEERNLIIKNRNKLEKKLEKARTEYRDKYSDDLMEVNARIGEVIVTVSRGLGINLVTGEGWSEIAKKWADSAATLGYSGSEFRAEQVFNMINDGNERGFIEYILSVFKVVLHLDSASPQTKKRYIDRISGIYNRLREIHRQIAPPTWERR